MRLATHRQQRLDADIDAGADIGRATVPAISEQASDFAQQIRQRLQRGDTGCDLLLVIGGLRQARGDIDGRLRVVTLLEAAPRDRHRHDARVGMSQIALVVRAHARTRWGGRFAAWLVARALGLFRAHCQFGVVLGLVTGQTLGSGAGVHSGAAVAVA